MHVFSTKGMFNCFYMIQLFNVQHLFLYYSNSILGVQKHGGTIVYCAKTLSPSQCDTVVYAAINEVMQNSDVTLSVVDMAYMAEKFSETFKFCSVKPFCHLGQLVLPNTTANFGPLYFCRIDVEGTES